MALPSARGVLSLFHDCNENSVVAWYTPDCMLDGKCAVEHCWKVLCCSEGRDGRDGTFSKEKNDEATHAMNYSSLTFFAVQFNKTFAHSCLAKMILTSSVGPLCIGQTTHVSRAATRITGHVTTSTTSHTSGARLEPISAYCRSGRRGRPEGTIASAPPLDDCGEGKAKMFKISPAKTFQSLAEDA